MTDVMEMKRSSLVLPMTGYELDREEMCYVDGGKNNVFYETTNQIQRENGVAIFAYFAIFLGVAGSAFSTFGAALAMVPEPTLLTKVAALISNFVGKYLSLLAGSSAVCALIAIERCIKNKNYTIGIETLFGIPISFTCN